MSILQRTRDKEAYFEKIESMSRATKEAARSAINNFEEFCKSKYDSGHEQVLEEINASGEQKEHALYEVLQAFVNHLNSKELSSVSIRSTFKRVKPYLSYRLQIRIHAEDIKSEIKFPKTVKRKQYPLTQDHVKTLLDYCTVTRKALYLTLLSSGIRIQEACYLRKRDFDHDLARYRISLRPKYTKTHVERVTFISKEAEQYVKPILDKIGDDDLVFAGNQDAWRSELTEEAYFSRIRRRAKLTDRYDSGTAKITLHSFRSFFISKCAKIDMAFGHALAGHEHYMKEYERFTDQELLEFYLKAEPNLLIYSSEPSKEVKELREEVDFLEKKVLKMARGYRHKAMENAELREEIRKIIREELK